VVVGVVRVVPGHVLGSLRAPGRVLQHHGAARSPAR
jgi:hypothetical protein